MDISASASIRLGPRAIATMPVRDTSTRPERPHQVDELVDLVGRAGDLEDEALGRGVDHPGAEDVGQAQRLDPLLAGALAP